jgi:glutamyl-tRNA reductase
MSHADTPVEVRERVAFPSTELPTAIAALRDLPSVAEAVILSTCNRMEIYAAGPAGVSATEVEGWLRQRFGLDHTVSFFSIRDAEAARHLFAVASGLDSMVLGETEIFGQVKAAYDAAHKAGGTARLLNRLFQKSFTAGKLVRTQTDIQRGATSVGSVAVELAGKIFGDLKDSQVMLLGAGDMSRRCAQSLQSRGARSIVVSNRNYDRAVEMATEMDGRAVHFDGWPQEAAAVDVIISSTSAPHVVITPEALAPALRRRRGRPLFIIDIAVPRDVDPRVNDLADVYLYDIDALESIAAETRTRRHLEIERCRAIIDEQVRALPVV